MNILEAYDLTGALRDAAYLGCWQRILNGMCQNLAEEVPQRGVWNPPTGTLTGTAASGPSGCS